MAEPANFDPFAVAIITEITTPRGKPAKKVIRLPDSNCLMVISFNSPLPLILHAKETGRKSPKSGDEKSSRQLNAREKHSAKERPQRLRDALRFRKQDRNGLGPYPLLANSGKLNPFPLSKHRGPYEKNGSFYWHGFWLCPIGTGRD